MVDTQRSGIFDFARSMGGVPVYVIVGATSAALGSYLVMAEQQGGAVKPALTALALLFGAVVGALWAAHHARKIDPHFRDDSFTPPARAALNRFDETRNNFLAFAAAATCVYIIGFWIAVDRFPTDHNDGWPLSLPVMLVTAATIAAETYFVVRYAFFVRMLVGLGAMIGPGQPVSESRRPLIGDLRNSVFRDEQLYEPPGNIFVTMGITATFLGLAVGLSMMDLTAISKKQDLSSATSFIGCMGLALGISMLGVLLAIAAQWLRGHGPRLSTEMLLERSLDAAEQARAGANAS